MTDRTARRAVDRRTARLDLFQRMRLAHTIGAVRRGQAWYNPAPRLPIAMAASRSVESFAGAKDRARQTAETFTLETEHWADALLRCPSSSLNHRTARFAGKPYHWRQDYTGQLKLAAGESPW